jgi:hypothetical protein
MPGRGAGTVVTVARPEQRESRPEDGQVRRADAARLIGPARPPAGINYRHIIDSLLRKPGGFRDYRYREALFPGLVFRQAWEQLNAWYAPRRADLIYLRILHLAAQTLESAVPAPYRCCWTATSTSPSAK